MNIIEALENRKSTRAFLEKDVSDEQISRILNAARHAPSGTNAQPWDVAVVTGEPRKKLTTSLVEAFQNDGLGEMDYQYYPVEWKEPFKKRRVTCGAQLYSALKIERRDKEKRLEQWVANYRGFDAPVLFFFFLDSVMEKGSFLDYGMFIQSIMLAALEEGLATCAQAALGQYPELIKTTLGYGPDSILLCGMALGYEDTTAPQNNYRTTREEIEVFTKFFK
ncbi:MAG: nitroreductase [Desulforhopalus sp.]|jgi:nitroreductase